MGTSFCIVLSLGTLICVESGLVQRIDRQKRSVFDILPLAKNVLRKKSGNDAWIETMCICRNRRNFCVLDAKLRCRRVLAGGRRRRGPRHRRVGPRHWRRRQQNKKLKNSIKLFKHLLEQGGMESICKN